MKSSSPRIARIRTAWRRPSARCPVIGGSVRLGRTCETLVIWDRSSPPHGRGSSLRTSPPPRPRGVLKRRDEAAGGRGCLPASSPTDGEVRAEAEFFARDTCGSRRRAPTRDRREKRRSAVVALSRTCAGCLPSTSPAGAGHAASAQGVAGGRGSALVGAPVDPESAGGQRGQDADPPRQPLVGGRPHRSGQFHRRSNVPATTPGRTGGARLSCRERKPGGPLPSRASPLPLGTGNRRRRRPVTRRRPLPPNCGRGGETRCRCAALSGG